MILGVAGQDASEQFHQFHNKAVLKKYEKRLRIGSVKGSTKKETPKAESSGQQGKREEAASKQVQQSKQAATTPAKLEDRVFGDLSMYLSLIHEMRCCCCCVVIVLEGCV